MPITSGANPYIWYSHEVDRPYNAKHLRFDTEPLNIRPLMRQITEAERLFGNPTMDCLFKQNNEINHVKIGDYGYYPLSYEYNNV